MRGFGLFFFSSLSLGVLSACVGGSDGGTRSSTSSTSSSSGSSRTVTGGSSTSDESAADTTTGGGSSGTSSSGSTTTKETFPCGPDKDCEVGREACVYFDGSPFACHVITVSNQCNAKSCTNASASFQYICDRTNYKNTSCEMGGGDPCKMTISCDP